MIKERARGPHPIQANVVDVFAAREVELCFVVIEGEKRTTTIDLGDSAPQIFGVVDIACDRSNGLEPASWTRDQDVPRITSDFAATSIVRIITYMRGNERGSEREGEEE